MKKQYLAVTTAVLAAMLLAACGNDGETGARGGAKNERDAVDAYVSALNSKDTEALTELAPPGNDADSEAVTLIKAKGGLALTITSVDVKHDFGPDVAAAHVVTRSEAGKTLNEDLTLTRSSDRWYIAMGENPKGHDKTPATANKP